MGKLSKAQTAILADACASEDGHICGEQLGHSWLSARSLERRGLIRTDKCGEWFDCFITEAGRAALKDQSQ